MKKPDKAVCLLDQTLTMMDRAIADERPTTRRVKLLKEARTLWAAAIGARDRRGVKGTVDHAEILRLHGLKTMTPPEIAARIGCGVATVYRVIRGAS